VLLDLLALPVHPCLDVLRRAELGIELFQTRFITGEGLTFGIPEGTAEAFLLRRGFKQVRDVAMPELKAVYFTGKNASRKVAGGYGIAIGKI
jgi:hypothetical protein